VDHADRSQSSPGVAAENYLLVVVEFCVLGINCFMFALDPK